LTANLSLISYIDGDSDNIIHWIALYLQDKLGITIMSLVSAKCNDEVQGWLRSSSTKVSLPIHYAAEHSTANIVELLLELYRESRSATNSWGDNLLHLAQNDPRQERAPVNAKVQYLCDHCPDLLQLRADNGHTPLDCYLATSDLFDLETITIMCQADKTLVTQIGQHIKHNGYLPLHFLLGNSSNTFISNISV
jgi:ankyrin repeat protein